MTSIWQHHYQELTLYLLEHTQMTWDEATKEAQRQVERFRQNLEHAARNYDP